MWPVQDARTSAATVDAGHLMTAASRRHHLARYHLTCHRRRLLPAVERSPLVSCCDGLTRPVLLGIPAAVRVVPFFRKLAGDIRVNADTSILLVPGLRAPKPAVSTCQLWGCAHSPEQAAADGLSQQPPPATENSAGAFDTGALQKQDDCTSWRGSSRPRPGSFRTGHQCALAYAPDVRRRAPGSAVHRRRSAPVPAPATFPSGADTGAIGPGAGADPRHAPAPCCRRGHRGIPPCRRRRRAVRNAGPTFSKDCGSSVLRRSGPQHPGRRRTAGGASSSCWRKRCSRPAYPLPAGRIDSGRAGR